MARKNNFLSIGEVAKYTGASIDSLRYYERIKLLEPALIDPDSGYRYYSFDQVYLVEVISLCIELDIPLKELTQHIIEGDTIDYSGLLAHGKRIAEEKFKVLRKGLKLINDIEQKIALTETYPQGGEIYTRKIQEKYFCVSPCKRVLKKAKPFEVIKKSLDLYYYEDNYDEWLYSELLEYGFLCEHTAKETKYYMFAELPKKVAMTVTGNIMKIPSGLYFCTRNEESQLEQAPQIFNDYLKNNESFLAVETDIFTSQYKINNPTSELRIIHRN